MVSTYIPVEARGDWSPEHKRIAALMPVDTAEAQKALGQVTILMNLSNELRRKVPVGK